MVGKTIAQKAERVINSFKFGTAPRPSTREGPRSLTSNANDLMLHVWGIFLVMP